MPVVVMSQRGGHSTISGTRSGPSSHIGLAVFALLVCPPLGLIALCFALSSRHVAAMDWDGARFRGKISMSFSVAGIILTSIAVLVVVLVFFTKDNNS